MIETPLLFFYPNVGLNAAILSFMKNNTKFLSDAMNEEPFLEKQKNDLLAAIYCRDYHSVESCFTRIFKRLSPRLESKNKTFPENDEKLLNQIFLILKIFHGSLASNCSKTFFDSKVKLKRLLLNRIRAAGNPDSQHIGFKDWQEHLGLNLDQSGLLFATAMTFQLSKGCSNFCRRCNEWALPKVRAHFSFSAVIEILKQMVNEKNTDISLYGASDPLDYQDEDKTITDIVRYIKPSGLEYSLLTKAPRGRIELLKDLIQSNANISVSMTGRNKQRIMAIEADLKQAVAKQHDTDDLLIPACLDEDFQTVKPSITDGYGTEITPDGAFIILPAFTSALHPFGHKKIAVTGQTNIFPVKKTGRKALLVDYFKPLEVYDLKKNRFHLDHLLPVQIESILLDNGHDDLTPPGMRSVKEYFSIFGAKARQQRKKMTRSVLKKLKKQYLGHSSFVAISGQKRQEYLRKIKAHVDLCQEKNCLAARKDTAAFFLSQILKYRESNPTKIIIIRFLLEDEIKRQPLLSKEANFNPDLFSDPGTDAFTLFRKIVLQMISSEAPLPLTVRFISNNPSSYDPVADMFTRH